MVRRVALLLVLALLFAGGAAEAETKYYFEVPEMVIDVRPNEHGMTRIEYAITFTNRSPDPLDIVDIGVPHDDYELGTFQASINGANLSTIRPSQYVKPGVEVPLTGHEIANGATAVFRISFEMPKMIYFDDNDANYTSLEFGNTFFGSDYTTGQMKLRVNFHFPDKVTGNETKWHRQEPTSFNAKSDHIIFTYVVADASPSRMYKFGIGFPIRYVDKKAIQKHSACLDLANQCMGLIGAIGPVALPLAIFGLPIMIGIIAARRRRKHYLPPSIGIEGAGIKRGLTAPEAAVLLELPPDRVLTMVLFGLIKKQALRIVKDKPLRVETVTPAPEGLLPYERDFLKARKGDGSFDEGDLRTMFITFVRAVNTKIKGFSRKESRAYYQNVVKTAWDTVAQAETPQVGEAFATRSEWLLLDSDYADRTKKIFHDRDVVIFPHWWGWGHGWSHGGGGHTAGTDAGGSFSMPGASFAHDFTTRLSNFSNSVVDNVSSFTASITNITNPPPPSSRGSGGRSGGGCACACACAGCACACAGGGR